MRLAENAGAACIFRTPHTLIKLKIRLISTGFIKADLINLAHNGIIRKIKS